MTYTEQRRVITCTDRHYAIACEMHAVELAHRLQALVNRSPHASIKARELLKQIREFDLTPTIKRTLVP